MVPSGLSIMYSNGVLPSSTSDVGGGDAEGIVYGSGVCHEYVVIKAVV
jgi:hypothetical protein